MAVAIESQIQSLIDIIKHILIKLNVATVLDLKTILEESISEIVAIRNSLSEAQLNNEESKTSNRGDNSFQSDIPREGFAREEHMIEENNEVLISSKDDIPIVDIGIMNESDSLGKHIDNISNDNDVQSHKSTDEGNIYKEIKRILKESGEDTEESVCNISEFSSRGQKENHILEDHWVDVNSEDFKVTMKTNEEDVGESKIKHKRIKKELSATVCNLCGKNYPSARRMQAHVREYHDGSVLQCVHCSKKLIGKKSMIIHMRIHNPKVECSVCHNMFQEVSIKRHLRKCLIDPQLKAQLKRLKKKHKTYICQTCDLKFIDRRKLRIHRRSHRVNCQNCSKSFLKQKLLERHIERIHIAPKLEVIPVDKYHYCGQCEYKTMRRIDLKRHMNVHTNSKNRVLKERDCNLCGHKFKSPYNLKRHRCKKDVSNKDETLIFTWTGN